VIAHEIAHQWFGNMVTPAWWDDIWLNEAFATWMARTVIHRLFPEWNSPSDAVERKAEVMGQDGLLSARRIRQPIGNHGDIGNAFDGITYQKGAAVIRMFEKYVGEERLQRGVRAYMKKHAWGNATAGDFLAAISAGAGQNVAPAFSKFLDRGGLPLITVSLNCGAGKASLVLSQSRSLPVGSKGSEAEFWSVPVCVRYGSGGQESRECFVLSDPRDEVALRNARSCPDWLTASDAASGYYHVKYEPALAEKLLKNVARLQLHEQVDLLRNTLALLRGGHVSVEDALGLARVFRNAPERQLVTATVDIVTSVRRIAPPELSSRYAHVIREFYGERARQLGWLPRSGEPAETRLLRVELLPLVAGQGGDPALAKEAAALADRWLKDRTAIPAQIAGPVLETAAWHGDEHLYERFVAELKRTRNRRDRGKIVDAIGNVRDPAIARRALGLLLDPSVDVRELTDLFTAFNDDPATERLPWLFVRENYDRLLPRLPNRLGTHAGSILPASGGALCSEADYGELEAFFKDRIGAISGGERVLAKTLEGIALCDARRRVQAAEVAAWLRRYSAE
jgi:alanyl aminopeptidase